MNEQSVALPQHYPKTTIDEIDSWIHNIGLEPSPPRLSLEPSAAYLLWKPRIIGLCGKARSGKDTAANMLQTIKPTAGKVAFADPIRAAAKAMFDFTDEHLHGKLKEVVIPRYGKSPRQIMQTLGTEWGRDTIHEDLWLLIAEEKIDAFVGAGRWAIVTDVRFENEADFIRKKGGQIWHIRRGDAPAVSKHPSEAGVTFRADLGDIVINNNGTLDDLFEQVDDAALGDYFG